VKTVFITDPLVDVQYQCRDERITNHERAHHKGTQPVNGSVREGLHLLGRSLALAQTDVEPGFGTRADDARGPGEPTHAHARGLPGDTPETGTGLSLHGAEHLPRAVLHHHGDRPVFHEEMLPLGLLRQELPEASEGVGCLLGVHSVATGAETVRTKGRVHPSGHPISHSTKAGFSRDSDRGLAAVVSVWLGVCGVGGGVVGAEGEDSGPSVSIVGAWREAREATSVSGRLFRW
jgi:hypothetical protein